MAVRALALIMVPGSVGDMAVGAVGLSQVVEKGFRPAPGAMAIRALPNIMRLRCIALVAAHAIHELGMDKVILRPTGGVMAGRALPVVVPGGCIPSMAGLAVLIGAGMLVGQGFPGRGGMTAGALAGVMPTRGVRGVTTLAIPVIVMVEIGHAPCIGGMATGTSSRIMSGRRVVAVRARAHFDMYEFGVAPRAWTVAVLATLRVMVDRSAMADVALRQQVMYVNDFFPILAHMTVRALPVEML